jgi:hypothetical protein
MLRLCRNLFNILVLYVDRLLATLSRLNLTRFRSMLRLCRNLFNILVLYVDGLLATPSRLNV